MRMTESNLRRTIRRVILENLQDYIILDWLEDNSNTTDDVELLKLAKQKFQRMFTDMEIEEAVEHFVKGRMSRYNPSEPTTIKGGLPR